MRYPEITYHIWVAIERILVEQSVLDPVFREHSQTTANDSTVKTTPYEILEHPATK